MYTQPSCSLLVLTFDSRLSSRWKRPGMITCWPWSSIRRPGIWSSPRTRLTSGPPGLTRAVSKAAFVTLPSGPSLTAGYLRSSICCVGGNDQTSFGCSGRLLEEDPVLSPPAALLQPDPPSKDLTVQEELPSRAGIWFLLEAFSTLVVSLLVEYLVTTQL